MPAPLSPGYCERPLWWDDAELPVVPPVERLPASVDVDVDVAVIGAGYTGVAAATELARRGRSVLVLEREALGWGASTRNGGITHPGLKWDADALTRRWGPQVGPALHRATFDAFDHVEKLVADGLECDYVRSGHVVLAHHPRKVGAGFVGHEEVRSEIGSAAYAGGLVVEDSGGLHPAKLFAGLARRALDAGVVVAERTGVIALDGRVGAGFTVATSRGSVRAGDVLVATNGYTDRLVPALQRRVLPLESFIIATEVLEPALAAQVNPNGRMFFDTRNFLAYFRLSPDGRMLWGGRASLAPTSVARARDFLYRRMVAVHPQLAGVRVERAWGGRVGFTTDRVPHAGRVAPDGVAYALGYCGSGVALSGWLGARVAGWMCGDEPPPFVGLDFPLVPARRSSRATLPVAGTWYRARDLLGR